MLIARDARSVDREREVYVLHLDCGLDGVVVRCGFEGGGLGGEGEVVGAGGDGEEKCGGLADPGLDACNEGGETGAAGEPIGIGLRRPFGGEGYVLRSDAACVGNAGLERH